MKRRFLPSFAALQAFEAAARHGNFTQAGKELALTQGAISRQIRGLEDTLGVLLFNRVRQRVVLTELGGSYLDDVRRTLDSLERSSRRAMEMRTGSRIIEISTLPTFCSRWLIPRLGSFQAAHPDIVLNFSSHFMPFDLRDESFDLAIHFGAPVWPGATLHRLFAEHMAVCASPKYLVEHPISSDRDIAHARLLHQTTRPDSWADWFSASGVETQAAHSGPRYDQFSMIARATIAGLGISLLPEFFIQEELRNGDIVIVGEHRLEYPGSYYLVVPEEKSGNQTMVQFTQWLIEQAREFSDKEREPGAALR